MAKKKKQSKKSPLFYIFLSIILVALIFVGVKGFVYYMNTLVPNISVPECQKKYLLIYENDDFETVVRNLEATGAIINMKSFIKVAEEQGYAGKIVSGRYELEDGLDNRRLVKRLINGWQTPLRITFNNIRTKEILAQRLSDQLRMSYDDMLGILNNDQFLSEYGLNKATAMCLFIPNTYEVYWDISPEDLIKRMKKEYDRFWTKERLAKLNDVGLDQLEVCVLASIVEEETKKCDEKPIVAGLYLNRIHKGKPLESDPTVIFALQDFSIRRVYRKHLEYDSPYNTYRNKGLPPGPIRIPGIESLDAVLNYTVHNYIYMCAREDFSGYHNFASTYTEHQRNAAKYRRELQKKGIR
jgi:UPF0755 protein